MYMIFLVLHDPSRMKEVLSAWEDAGVSGVTILPSTGMQRLQSSDAYRDDVPLIPNIEDLLQYKEKMNRTFFTVVPSETMVDQVVEATQNVVGDLNLPNTGILVVLPVLRAYGLDRKDYQNEDTDR
jgi:nitrogen regulatory protein PII